MLLCLNIINIVFYTYINDKKYMYKTLQCFLFIDVMKYLKKNQFKFSFILNNKPIKYIK